MAKQLARIFGTEEDKINCPFYFKIGACRHGERCSRIHNKPAFSPTLLIKHIYPNPVRAAEMAALLEVGGTDLANYTNAKVQVNKEQAMEDFLQFFENFYTELGKFGPIESLHVCDNLCEHMLGHVYCKFFDEEDASDALAVMNGRYYNGQKMVVEFSPVFDFRDARCRDFDEGECSRGGFCNFMHIKPVPMCLIRSLEEDCDEDRRRRRWEKQEAEREREHREQRERERENRDRDETSRKKRSHKEDRERERDRDRDRDYDRSRDKTRDRDRDREKDKEREKDKDKDRERKKSRKSKRRDSSDQDDNEDNDDGHNHSD